MQLDSSKESPILAFRKGRAYANGSSTEVWGIDYFFEKNVLKKFYFVHNLHKLYYTHAYIKLHSEVQFFIV